MQYDTTLVLRISSYHHSHLICRLPGLLLWLFLLHLSLCLLPNSTLVLLSVVCLILLLHWLPFNDIYNFLTRLLTCFSPPFVYSSIFPVYSLKSSSRTMVMGCRFVLSLLTSILCDVFCSCILRVVYLVHVSIM